MPIQFPSVSPSLLFCSKHSLVDFDEETPGFQKRNLESTESEPGGDFLSHILGLIEGP